MADLKVNCPEKSLFCLSLVYWTNYYAEIQTVVYVGLPELRGLHLNCLENSLVLSSTK